ncbi:MAG: AMP-binding protein, partial [Pseudorhodoplanes sp.]|nr:AMP-binding protein [Pseudorhodoplanes sp.]
MDNATHHGSRMHRAKGYSAPQLEVSMGNITISDVLCNVARRWPDKVGYIYAAQRHTWAEVDRRVSALAAGLRAHGIGPRDVVATCTHDGPVLVETIFAAARLGAVRVGINYRLSASEASRLI